MADRDETTVKHRTSTWAHEKEEILNLIDIYMYMCVCVRRSIDVIDFMVLWLTFKSVCVWFRLLWSYSNNILNNFNYDH